MSGLDLPDDGRGVAVCDWDQDGDLDLWISNRTGPSVRFLRNELENGAQFIALQLQGKNCNRDAIGARVELRLQGATQPIVRSLRGGDGFLSQSSKSIHIGLGPDAEIDDLIIHWPGGEPQRLTGIETEQRYLIVQGSPASKMELAARPAPADGDGYEDETLPVRVFTHAPIPLPPLRYLGDDGEPSEVVIGGKPVLLNLWASWCAPCVTELESFATSEALRQFGLSVVAVSADSLNGDEEAARALLAKAAWPFRSGFATQQLLDRCQMIHDFIFDLHEPIPVPTSFLIDGEGNLQAIFKGAIEPDWLVSRISTMMQAPPFGDARRKLVQPFDGRWIAPARRLNFAPIAAALAAQDPIEDALGYFNKNRQILANSPQAARLYVALGSGLEKAGRPGEAKQFYRRALNRSPGFIEALRSLESLDNRSPATTEP